MPAVDRLTPAQIEYLNAMPGDIPAAGFVVKPNTDPLRQPIPHATVQDAEGAIQASVAAIQDKLARDVKPGERMLLIGSDGRHSFMSVTRSADGTLSFRQDLRCGTPRLTISPEGEVRSFGRKPKPDLNSGEYREHFNLVAQCAELVTEGTMRPPKNIKPSKLRAAGSRL